MLTKKNPEKENSYICKPASPSTRAVATKFSQATQTSKSANTAKRLAILKGLIGNKSLPIAMGQLVFMEKQKMSSGLSYQLI